MPKILIVEDERPLNQAYQMILDAQGAYEVYTAFDGHEALQVTDTVEPDLILLDLRMPRMGGVEFLRRFQPKKKHADVKIIIFSNLDMQKEIDEAFQLGADKYILKAWATPKELVQIVKSVLGNNHKHKKPAATRGS